MLNLDGTPIRDPRIGTIIPTYDTNDILTFARIWTGFDYAPRRGNYEEKDPNRISWNDPMTLLDADKHDWFPKKDLLDGWIGDRYPLCSDEPAKAYLKKGAVYKCVSFSDACVMPPTRTNLSLVSFLPSSLSANKTSGSFKIAKVSF